MAKNRVKLILNLCLIASAAVPRGGTISVKADGGDTVTQIRLEAKGPYARVANGVQSLLDGVPEGGSVDAHAIQPFFTGLVARAVGMAATIVAEGDTVVIAARPVDSDGATPAGGAQG